MKPLIGVVTYHQLIPETGWLYDVSYVNNASVVEEAGGIPVLIPTGISQDSLRGLYERLDGLLLPGGGDINPQHYGADKHPAVSLVSDERDLVELSLMRWAAEDDRPVLGICRGVQLM
ncbi:MAG: gamma-glutamyl-gamma-aminobutyrate hydrolase family protein, partial [Pirellulales bacterium]